MPDKPEREAREAEARRVVDAYADMLLRLGYAYLHSQAEAEDVRQEVLLKLLHRAEPFESAEAERAWVIAVARNACANVLKSARWRTTEELDPEAPGTAALFDAADTYDELLDAVARLPLAYREAIHLRYYEGLSVREIAELGGESEQAVNTRLSRARAMLRDRLGDER